MIAHEHIEKWFKALGKNSKEACRMLRADVLPKWHWRDGRTITSRELIELLDKVVERVRMRHCRCTFARASNRAIELTAARACGATCTIEATACRGDAYRLWLTVTFSV